MRRVFQVVPFLEHADAIGDHARNLARALGEAHAGFIVERAAPGLPAVRFGEARVGPDDVLVYHVAHGSALAGWFAAAAGVKVVDYHGITPPAMVRGWDAGLAVTLDRARAEVVGLAGVVSLAIAHSGYMAGELAGFGFPADRTAVLPLLVDRERLATPPTPAVVDRLAAGGRGHDLLFVGRMAPNKRVEDLIKVFAVYRRAFQPEARLFLVGRPDTDSYQAALAAFVARLGVEEVHFAGSVPVADLTAYYTCADAFVSMSEHEGFGVPWLEAMAFGLPVIALGAGAVPETVGAGGVVFEGLGYDEVAALVDLVLTSPDLRARLAAAGRERLASFPTEGFAASARELLGSIRA